MVSMVLTLGAVLGGSWHGTPLALTSLHGSDHHASIVASACACWTARMPMTAQLQDLQGPTLRLDAQVHDIKSRKKLRRRPQLENNPVDYLQL